MGSLSDSVNSSMTKRKEEVKSSTKLEHKLQINPSIRPQNIPTQGVKLTELYDCLVDGLGFNVAQGTDKDKKISGWSPRNIRKLIIGVDAVLVVYHIKYKEKYVQIISLKKAYQQMRKHIKDLRKQQKQFYYYPMMSILDTSNWSNYALGGLEEIIFIQPTEVISEKDLKLLCGQFVPRNQQEMLAYAQREGMFGLKSLQKTKVLHYKGLERIQVMESYIGEEVNAVQKYITHEAVSKTLNRLANVTVLNMNIPLLGKKGTRDAISPDLLMNVLNTTDFKRNGTDANKYHTYIEYLQGNDKVKPQVLMKADGWQTGLPKGAANRFEWESADGELALYFKDLVVGYKSEEPLPAEKPVEIDMGMATKIADVIKCMNEVKITNQFKGSALLSKEEVTKILEENNEIGKTIKDYLVSTGIIGEVSGDFKDRSVKVIQELYKRTKDVTDTNNSKLSTKYPLLHKVAVTKVEKELKDKQGKGVVAELSKCFTLLSYQVRSGGYNYNLDYWYKRMGAM